MNLTRISGLLVRFGILVTVGCASPPFPESSLTGVLFEVKIGESLTPTVVTAKRGDEVRWVNTTNGPVDISFVQTLDNLISCQKGFVSTGWGYLFASSSEIDFLLVARVHTNDSASLCFTTPGTYTYTIRTNTATTGHGARIAGSVMIE